MAVAGLSPVSLEKFDGLRFDVDPGEVGNGAVDSLNITYDRANSRVGSRYGYDVMATLPASSTPETIARFRTGTTDYWLVNNYYAGANQYALLDATGAVVYGGGAVGPNAFSYAQFGTPTVTRMYFADSNYVYKAQAGTLSLIFSAPALSPYASRHVCATNDGRLAYGSCFGAPDRVYFSDPANPETIQPNNYVDLAPGDGEQITAMCIFREQMFVFKETKFFVFYATSTDATGNPVFNYRTVNTGLGASNNTFVSPGVCVGRDGVYFSNGRSIYRTTGGEAISVSSAIDSYLQLGTLPLFGQVSLSGYASAQANIRLRWIDERLYVILTPVAAYTGPSGVFVLDLRTNAWSFWDMPVTDLIAGRPGETDERAYGVIRSTRQIVRLKRSLTTDNGVAITSRLRSGFLDFGSPGQEKVVRQTQITGLGTVSFGWARDHGASPSLTSVSLGTSPATARGLHRVAQQGESLSYTIQSTVPWQVNRIVPMVRSVRGGGERTS